MHFPFEASAINCIYGLLYPTPRAENKSACPYANLRPADVPVHVSSPHDHEYIPPSKDACRSPCPALNTLANHGYLPRTGHHITLSILADALHTGFGLTHVLASFLSYVGFFLQLGFHGFTYGWEVSLDDFARHNRIEHDASLAHADAGEGMLYAPCKFNRGRMTRFLKRAGESVGVDDIARVRVERERDCGGLDKLHGVISRGEMALVLGIFGSKPAKGEVAGEVPVGVLEKWWTEERFPEEGWAPKEQGMLETLAISSGIKKEMNKLREKEA